VSKLIEDPALRNRAPVFEDRTDAGKRLAEYLMDYRGSDALILAIPSGGVPVGNQIAQALNLEMDLIITRKVQIPWNTEAGFGAVNLDGDVILNQEMLRSLRLSDEAVDEQIRSAIETVKRRNTLFRKGKVFPELKDRTLVLVDDGLASGYTMRAAAKYVQKRNPRLVIIAVPTGSSLTIQSLASSADVLCCLNVRERFPYAVADAYRHWHDLSDEDVLHALGLAR
jgi:predicted phosphoribosyltransferase